MKQIIYAPIRDGVLEICRGLKSLRSSMIGPGLNLCRAIKSWSIKGGGLKDYFFEAEMENILPYFTELLN